MKHPSLHEGLRSGYYTATVHRAGQPKDETSSDGTPCRMQYCMDCGQVLTASQGFGGLFLAGDLVCQVAHEGWSGNYRLGSDRPRLPNETFCETTSPPKGI